MDFSTPDVNKAAIYVEPGVSLKTEVIERPIEIPGPGDVLVRLLYSGVCHTDVAFCSGRVGGITGPKGQVGGHEGVGVVIAQGPGVDSPPLNSVVGVKYTLDACLSCDNCLEGGETSCLNAKIGGLHAPGTFQQYCIASSRYVTPIPETLDPAAAAPLLCAGVTVYNGLKRAELRPGQWVAIPGAGGGVGHMGVQYAKTMGARVLAIDVGAKRELCVTGGADEFLDFTTFTSYEELAAKVKEVTHGGARIVLQCTSSPKVYTQSMSWLGFRGKLVCVGLPEGDANMSFNLITLIDLEQRIIGLKAGNRLDLKEALEVAVQGRVKAHYELRPIEKLTETFEEMNAGKIQGRVILDLR